MSIRARVTITLEITADSHWGDEVKGSQVRKQALEDVKGALRHGLVIEGMTSSVGNASTKTPARIVGEPKVVAILADLKEETT